MKVLFHDVDGCLNAEDGHPIGNSDIVLTQRQRDGMAEMGRVLDASPIDMLVLNTGRSLAATRPMAVAINSPKLRYLLGEHGAVGFDLHREEEIDLRALARACNAPAIAAAYAGLGEIQKLMDWYHSVGHARMERRIGQRAKILAKSANLTFETPQGVAQDQMVAAILDLFQNDSPFDVGQFVFHDSGGDGYVDVMSLVDKGHGVRLIGDAENGTVSHTYGVGNGLNDLPMMREVDTAICPANSEPELIEFCRSKGGHISQHSYICATIEWLRAIV